MNPECLLRKWRFFCFLPNKLEGILSVDRHEYSYSMQKRVIFNYTIMYSTLKPLTNAQTVRGAPTPKDDHDLTFNFERGCSANS